MNLLGYSDSEGSDDEAPQIPKPAAKPALKPSFQKVIDRSQLGKIKLNLPAPTQQKGSKDDIEAEAPPAKKLRTGGGAFGGFNAMLPAPKKSGAVAPAASDAGEEGPTVAGKRGAGRGLGSGVSLKTGAEPAFRRGPRLIDDEEEETGIPKSNSDFRASLNLPPPKTEEKSSTSAIVESTRENASKLETEAKPAKKPVKFMPLSVAQGKKKRPAVAAAPVPAPGTTKTAAMLSTVDPKPAAKPKVSLFGAAQPDRATSLAHASSGAYEPLLYGQDKDDEDADIPDEAGRTNAYDAQSSQAQQGAPPANQNLTDIAAELNLSESERRQLLGRRGRGDDLSGINIVDFNIDREYAHNEHVRLQGETVQHNALKSISGTGKNSLRSLINVAVTQKDALEDHFAQGKKNKREAGSKYGWTFQTQDSQAREFFDLCSDQYVKPGCSSSPVSTSNSSSQVTPYSLTSMFWQTITLAALLAQDASAVPQRGGGQSLGSSSFLRFGCSQLVVERTDPLVNPGLNFSPHTHQVVGGNSFNLTMDPASHDPVKQSTCTSCIYTEDTSNYWTASMYFKSPENGTFKRVPQMANGRLNGTLLEQDGGLTVYYMLPFSGSNKKVTSFKPGFRMLAGDPTNKAKNTMAAGICHRCLAKSDRTSGGSGAPCDSSDTSTFPTKPCAGGIRATIIFPSCWDGVNLDSPDHRSHMAYSSGAALAGDKCPSTHPVRVPQVMYEIMFDTSGFADAKYYKNGQQPLVYSFGDATGYGAHGDYLFGWKDDALQRAMDALGSKCGSEYCDQVLKIQSGKDAIACTKQQQAKEDVGSSSWLTALPGGVQVTN